MVRRFLADRLRSRRPRIIACILVAAAARHRRDAFHAVDFLMDYLKSAAWFWKREKRPDGWHWIEPRAQDFADRNRWV